MLSPNNKKSTKKSGIAYDARRDCQLDKVCPFRRRDCLQLDHFLLELLIRQATKSSHELIVFVGMTCFTALADVQMVQNKIQMLTTSFSKPDLTNRLGVQVAKREPRLGPIGRTAQPETI